MEVFLPESLEALVAEMYPDGGGVRLRFTVANRGLLPFVPSIRLVGDTTCLQPVAARVLRGSDETKIDCAQLIGRGLRVGELGEGHVATVVADYVFAGVDDLSSIRLQMILSTPEGAIGSNVAQFLVRSTPDLEADHSFAVVDGRPMVRVVVSNRGAAPAHDVVVRIPCPVGCIREDADERIEIPVIAAGSSIVLEAAFTFAGASPARLLLPPVTLSALEVPARTLPEISIEAGKPDVRVSIVGGGEVAPGELVRAAVRVENVGRGKTGPLVLNVLHDADLLFAIGSLRDGLAPKEPASATTEDLSVLLSALDPGDVRELSWSMHVGKAADRANLYLGAEVSGDGVRGRAEASFTVRRRPDFARSSVRLDREIVAAGSILKASIRITNDGNERATAVRIELAGSSIANVAGFEAAGGRWVTSVGILEAGEIREIEAEVALKAIESSAQDRLSMWIQSAEQSPIALSGATFRIESEPKFDEGVIAPEDESGLLHDDPREAIVLVANTGTGVARSAYVEIHVPENIEVSPARLALGDVAAGALAEGRFTLRVREAVLSDVIIAISAVAGADNHAAIRLTPLLSQILSEAGIAGEIIATLNDNVGFVGQVVELTMTIENTGTGIGRGLEIEIEPMVGTDVLAGSVSLNGFPREFNERGRIVVETLAPRCEATLSWHVRLLAESASRYCAPCARVAWGQGKTALIAGHPFLSKARTVIGADRHSEPRALRLGSRAGVPDAVVSTGPSATPEPGTQPPATPPELAPQGAPEAAPGLTLATAPETTLLGRETLQNEVRDTTAADVPGLKSQTASPEPATGDLRLVEAAPVAILEHELEAGAITKAERFLRGCGGRGLLSHVIGLSRLLPTRFLTDEAAAADAYARMVDAVRDTADRLFICSNLAGYTPASTDVEPPEMRAAIDAFISAIKLHASDAPASADLPLYATVPLSGLQELIVILETAPEGSALVYLLLVGCIATKGAAPAAPALEAYRDALERVFASNLDTVAELVASKPDTTEIDSLLEAVIEAFSQITSEAAA